MRSTAPIAAVLIAAAALVIPFAATAQQISPGVQRPAGQGTDPVTPSEQRLCDLKYLSCLDRARYERNPGETKRDISSFERSKCERDKRWCLKQATFPPQPKAKPKAAPKAE